MDRWKDAVRTVHKKYTGILRRAIGNVMIHLKKLGVLKIELHRNARSGGYISVGIVDSLAFTAYPVSNLELIMDSEAFKQIKL